MPALDRISDTAAPAGPAPTRPCGLVLGYAGLAPERIAEGIALLGAVVAAYRARP